MPIFTKSGCEPIFFAHIPKTGGSSAEEMFRDAGYRMTRWGGHGVTNQHAVTELYTTWDDLPEKKFVIIRDPIDRCVSELNYRRVARDRVNRTVENWITRCKKNPTFNDNHIRFQADFIVPGMDLYIFEEGAHQQIAEDYGLSPRHDRRSPKLSSRDDLSEKSLELLRDFYRKDIEMYESYRSSSA